MRNNDVVDVLLRHAKIEMYYRYRFTTQARARFVVAEYIEGFYNRGLLQPQEPELHSWLPNPSEVLTHYYDAAFAA